VGPLVLVREIGRGGFGVVFEARDRATGGGRVALKTVRSGVHLPSARESLLREIDAGRLRHPNIVAVLGSGRCGPGPYVVFEHLSGETLKRRLERGPVPAGEAIGMAAAIARALAHAHGHGVLHRDLKPSNVFLPRGGEPKLIDFGLARVLGASVPSGSGTPGYMAPEQRRGGTEDARTDLFALGLLVHEMATGKPLLDREGARAAGPPSCAAQVPPALADLIASLVAPDPDLRPGSAERVIARLEAIEERLEAGSRRGAAERRAA
jgi:serine/threonine protein kinase